MEHIAHTVPLARWQRSRRPGQVGDLARIAGCGRGRADAGWFPCSLRSGRCRVRAPRTVLPSRAITLRWPIPPTRVHSQAPRIESNAVASRRLKVRRIADSDGTHRPAGPNAARRFPNEPAGQPAISLTLPTPWSKNSGQGPQHVQRCAYTVEHYWFAELTRARRRKRESGVRPELPRSGERERPSSSALDPWVWEATTTRTASSEVLVPVSPKTCQWSTRAACGGLRPRGRA